MLAQRIDALPGWWALTDVETAIGTVPLVAVGRAGVFAIGVAEATAASALADVPERALIHVWAQAKHLERRRIGSAVTPVLALDGAVAGRRRGVHVLPLDGLDAWLADLSPTLDEADAGLVLSRLQDAPQTLLLAA